MSQHDFNIGNQLFPATRTDLNNALVALASNSSGDTAPATTYANQFWYETDTNKLQIRNESNSAWIEIATLDQSGGAVQSITTAGLTLGSTAISASGVEINQLDGITRGSILYGNSSGATARLAKGSANTVLTSNGTDISWVSSTALPVTNAGPDQVAFPNWASPNSTYTTSGTWSKGTLADTDYVWIYLLGGGSGGGKGGSGSVQGGNGGQVLLLFGQAQYFDGGAYVVGAGNGVSTGTGSNVAGGKSTFTTSTANGSAYYASKYYQSHDLFSLVESKQITNTATQISAQLSSHSVFVFPTDGAGNLTFPAIPSEATGSQTVWGNVAATGAFASLGQNSVFGGGGGGGAYASSTAAQGQSLYGGAGAAHNSGNDGAFPGGGGAGGDAADGSQSGSGANGSIRVYHV